MARKHKEQEKEEVVDNKVDAIIKILKEFDYELRPAIKFTNHAGQKVVFHPAELVDNGDKVIVRADAPYNKIAINGEIDNEGNVVKEGIIQKVRKKFGNQVNLSFEHQQEVVEVGKGKDTNFFGIFRFTNLDKDKWEAEKAAKEAKIVADAEQAKVKY